MSVGTKNYSLAQFLPNDIYSSLEDYRRFTTVDILSGRCSSIVKNGIADGFSISLNSFPYITVSSGTAFINKFFVTKFDDTVLELDVSQTFKIFLQRRVGVISSTSPRSDTASLVYHDDGPPSQPTSFFLELDEDNPYFKINLTWDEDTSIDFQKYEIHRSSVNSSSGFELIETVFHAAINSFSDITIDEDTEYFYKLYAVDQSGNFSEPAENNITTLLSPQLPPNPSSISMFASEYGVNILWSRPATLPFDKLQRYLLSYAELNTDDTEIDGTNYYFNINKELYNANIGNLDNGKTYKVILQTIDTKNRQSTGFSQNITPQPSPSAPDPINLSYTETQGPSGTRINLQWEPGDSEYDNAVSYRYNIYVQVDSQPESLAINVPVGLNNEQIDLYTFNLVQYFSIPQNTLITFRITSVTNEGYESFGSFIRFVTQQFASPSSVSNLTGNFNVNTGKITTQWNYNNQTSNMHIKIIGENLNDEYGSQETLIDDFITLTNVYVFDINLDHRYTITVTPYNSNNMAGNSEIIVLLTRVQGGLPLPEIPRNITAKSGDKKITLHWPSSTSLYTSHYKVYRHQGRVSFNSSQWSLIDIVPSTTLAFVDYGLENDEVWSYYVTSFDVYERESFHLIDDGINLNFVESIPRKSGILTEPDNVQLELDGNDINIAWDSLLEEFDVFAVYRSVNNLHSWQLIKTVNRETNNIVDENIALIDGYIYYYSIEKIINDCDVKVFSGDIIPENSILLGEVESNENYFESVNTSQVRYVTNIISTLEEHSDTYIKPHLHKEIGFFDPSRIDLNPQLIVTDWTTLDGKIFTTNELDLLGSSYLVKVNNTFPRVLYHINPSTRQIIFAEPIVSFNPDTGEIDGDLPAIEVQVLGVEETEGVLPAHRFDNLHAKQITFGKLPENQLPPIGHEGRLKEKLIPQTFLLERFGNHTFVVSENNVDETKTFGNGTAFYCVIDSNGLIDSVVDFESFPDASQVMFRPPIFSPITTDYLDSTYNLAEVTSDFGFQSIKSYHVQFKFIDDSPNNWVQLTTFDAEYLSNPILDLRKKIRFRIKVTGGSLNVSLGIREITSLEADVGSNGGSSGPIEWIGLTDVLFDDSGNPTPIGQNITPDDDWKEFEFDPHKQSAVSFIDGDNLITAPFGVLEHIAFTIDVDSVVPEGPFDVYIDNIYQFDDILVAGTSQGILLSQDFGSTWNLSRLTQTPVHKFYRALNNKFLWAISGNQVLLATDPANWFATQGTTGIQYIRDICEDSDGNMYISTERGVYWFQTSLINTFSSWRQTQPVNAFSTDCYGLYHNEISSGVSEIWVSTELGIYKTINHGQTWTNTGLDTSGLPAYQFMNIGSSAIFAMTKKHVLRKSSLLSNFEVVANLEEQHNLKRLWKFASFSDHLYLSTEDGVYHNIDNDPIQTSPTIAFDKVIPQIDVNGISVVAFGLDVVASDINGSKKLFIGLENRLMTLDENNSLSTRREYSNKEIPTFFINDEEVFNGYVYNAFNNVIIFREPILINDIIKCTFLPRKKYVAINGGWTQQNAESDVFIYVNGLPTWLDFRLDSDSILLSLQNTENNLTSAVGKLNSYNSLISTSESFLTSSLTSLEAMQTGGENDTPNINADTVREFFINYTRFQSLIDRSFALSLNLTLYPSINLLGFPKQNREPNSRAEVFETLADFNANDSTGIIINTTDGEVDFLTVFTTSTDTERKAEFVFGKYDQLSISVFNANVKNTGEFTHTELEDKFESRNTGLTSHLTQYQSSNMIKMGVFLERQNPLLFSRYPVSNIQSKFYAASNNEWYDVVNSTVDYQTIFSSENSEESRFASVLKIYSNDPYYGHILLIGTDKNIIQYQIESNGSLSHLSTWKPEEQCDIKDIFVDANNNLIYTVSHNNTTDESNILKSDDVGLTWTHLNTINLSQQIYKFGIINGVLIAATENGMFYSDNSFGTWYPSNVLPSISNTNDASLTAFSQRMLNLELNTFSVCESNKWFYVTSTGLEWISLKNQMTINSIKRVNKITRFKNLTWIATDKGLYNDANSILSDAIQFGLQSEMDESINTTDLNISDITTVNNALFCCANNIIYRYLNEEWQRYTLSNLSTIHKLVGIYIDEQTQFLYATSYNQIVTINISSVGGVFNND